MVSQLRGLGAIPSPPDSRDFALPLDLAMALPARFVATLMPPVLNQGTTPTCVAHAASGLKAWEERRDGHGFLPFDPFWLYSRAQAIDGIPVPHDGTTCRAALKVLLAAGEALRGHPETAGSFRIAAYAAVPLAYAALKAALAQHGPLLIASSWDRTWFTPVKGILPRPSGHSAGGHATLAFGYDDNVAGGSLLVRNSWGSRWGVNGNFYAPVEFFVLAMHDAWRVFDVIGG